MPQFYHDTVTDKSFVFLGEVGQQFDFVLIGGWAVFIYTNAMKSKDIDIIVEYDTLGKLRQTYTISKNERLKKYEIKLDGFDTDIYVAHYSDLGIPAENVKASAVQRHGFMVPKLEILFLLKLHAWENRRGSIKGRKDELDLFSLAFLPEFDWTAYSIPHAFSKLLAKARAIPELRLNEQQVARLRKKILEAIVSD